MQRETLKRMPVWGRWLRWVHWAMALLVMALLVTGFLVRHAPEFADAAREYHFIAGHTLVFVFFARVFLLFFGSRTDLLQALVPGKLEWRAAWAMFKFYLSLGRAPLPKWFAHNPFWMPIYLGFFALLLLQLVTGLTHGKGSVFDVATTEWLHALGATVLLWFSILHILAVFWHDAKGSAGDISAMVNGQRVFVVEKPRGLLGDAMPQRWTPPKSDEHATQPSAGAKVNPAEDPAA